MYSRAWVDRPLARRKGVRVMPAAMLMEHLRRQPARLSDAEVQRAQRRLHARCAKSARGGDGGSWEGDLRGAAQWPELGPLDASVREGHPRTQLQECGWIGCMGERGPKRALACVG